jgi:Yip1 domain
MTDISEPTVTAPAASAPSMSPIQRTIAIFARPSQAWDGLQERGQWWFPMVIMAIVSIAFTLVLHNRALVPMMAEAWDQQVADGRMQAAQVDRMVDFFSGPKGMAITAAQQAIAVPLVTLIIALVIWFGAGFVLGTKMKYRHALEVAAWSSLVTIPAYLASGIIAWTRETMRGVHVGLGALLPAMDEPTKIGVALRSFLDALGPLAIWYVVVGILGAAALSGAPRKSVAWVLGTVYVAIAVFMAAMAALFAPGV